MSKIKTTIVYIYMYIIYILHYDYVENQITVYFDLRSFLLGQHSSISLAALARWDEETVIMCHP